MNKPRIGIVISTPARVASATRPPTGSWLTAAAATWPSRSSTFATVDACSRKRLAAMCRRRTRPPAALGEGRRTRRLHLRHRQYNRGPPAWLSERAGPRLPEFSRKPVAFVGYGGVGAARAVEQLRLICVELQMAPTRSGVHIGGADFIGLFMQGKTFADMPHLDPTATTMLDELSWWTHALNAARAETALKAA